MESQEAYVESDAGSACLTAVDRMYCRRSVGGGVIVVRVGRWISRLAIIGERTSNDHV
jgi:hypothetical protein